MHCLIRGEFAHLPISPDDILHMAFSEQLGSIVVLFPFEVYPLIFVFLDLPPIILGVDWSSFLLRFSYFLCHSSLRSSLSLLVVLFPPLSDCCCCSFLLFLSLPLSFSAYNFPPFSLLCCPVPVGLFPVSYRVISDCIFW